MPGVRYQVSGIRWQDAGRLLPDEISTGRPRPATRPPTPDPLLPRYNLPVLSLEPEIRDLHGKGLVEDDAARTLVALERRELFSVHSEVRFLFWAAVSLVASSAALYLKEYADRIGTATIIGIVALVAAACYATAARIHRAEIERDDRSVVGISEYVLLMGALILSADLGYAESQYHFFGDAWSRHLLILAVVHGITAYLFASRLVLGASIASVIGWLGIERNVGFLLRNSWFAGERLILAAAILLLWRVLHGRFLRRIAEEHRRRLHGFADVLEHVAVNLGLIGSLEWVFNPKSEWAGFFVLAILVGGSIFAGIRTRREAFVVYGLLYGVVGFDYMVVSGMHDEGLIFFYLLVTTPIAIAALFFIHRRWRIE